jgi:hypothetical protein
MPLYQFKEKHSEVIKTRSSSNILSVIKGITPAEMPLFVEIMLMCAFVYLDGGMNLGIRTEGV